MLERLKSTVAMSGSLSAALLLTLSLPAAAQTTSASKDGTGTNSDALPFLNEVFELYAHANSYHIDSIEESTLEGEFSRFWTKLLTTAIVSPGNHFRFETQGDRGNALQISDGKTEWIYYPPFRQYIQHATPTTGPSRIQASVPGLMSLNMAQSTLKGLSSLQKLVHTAVYVPDETIEVNGKSIICEVIRTEGELPGTSAPIITRFIFWIDKHTKVIRKMTEHREGPLHPTEPDRNYVMDRETLFPVADLTPTSSSAQNFAFNPPMTASVVEKFEDKMDAGIRQLVGKQAPEITLRATDGKDVPLKSFQGKPVLLDFWATWCAPCVESLPAIEKLYHEAARSGLVLLSVDQDEEPNKAFEFWRMHNEPWANFHASADILGHFPEHGIPYFVLIDASGQVVFSAAGLDETALRAALIKLPSSKSAPP
jgi:thiol-disulfide isomerase/thioredoxin